jgi:chromosome segregation ATPase
MEEQQRTLVDMERLSRAETRAENMRAQLRDVQAKEADLQARLEQVEYDLKPENIERATQTFGSTRPEEVRAARQRQLENERTRIQSQLQLMAQSRARLETAIANADAEADAIRARMEQNGTAPKTDTGDTTSTTTPNEAPPTTTTTTTPPPDQPQ